MEYLLDGYNIIRSSWLKDSERVSTDSGRSALLILLEEYRRKHPSVMFTVVFDGAGDGCSSRGSGVRVLYSFDSTADDWIISLLAGKRRGACTVVSDDRQVRYGAKIHDYPVFGVVEFLETIAPEPKVPARLPEKSLVSTDTLFKIKKELARYYETKETSHQGTRKTRKDRGSVQGELRGRRQGP